MNRPILVPYVAALLAVGSPAATPTVAIAVTSEANAGPGSFREAINLANADPAISSIRFVPGVDAISLESPVVYTGHQPLTIRDPDGVTVAPFSEMVPFDLFATTNTLGLNIVGVSFVGSMGNGLTVTVPEGATGTLAVMLRKLSINDNDRFGAFIGEMDGMPTTAGVIVTLDDVEVIGNGLAGTDLDGVRFQERGPGSLTARLFQVTIKDNGADGAELEEDGSGDVRLAVANGIFSRNGLSLDPDDGIDIDENEGGNVFLTLLRVNASSNTDQGLDLDERDEGSFNGMVAGLTTNGNGDDGITIRERADGNINLALSKVTANENGGDGLEIEETLDGNFNLILNRPTLVNNLNIGLKLVQEAPGNGFAVIDNETIQGNGGGDIFFDDVVVQ